MGSYVIWAFAIGTLSAASLPLGSLIGLKLKPRPAMTGMAAAFGAGALIAALSVELVAPTAEAVHEDLGVRNLVSLIAGAVCGGLLFVVLDQIVSAHGGFLRKSATTISYFTTQARRRKKRLLAILSASPVLLAVPPKHVERLVGMLQPVTFEPDEWICREGEDGDRLFFIEKGELDLFQEDKWFKDLGPGEIVGEISLISGARRTASAKARDVVQAWILHKEDFDKLRGDCPELDEATRHLAASRLDELRKEKESRAQEAAKWANQAIKAIETHVEVPTADQVRKVSEDHPGAPLAIWLGILLDGIPESIVIGAGFMAILSHQLAAGHEVAFTQVIPYTLIAGLFLSNFPEAMSSSVGMQKQNWKQGRILLMWSSLMIMTGLGAVLGYALGGTLDPGFLTFIQGIAAGAMLTMIASTMIPEAVHLVNPAAVGLSSLIGFLSAVAFKIFEAH